MPAVPGWPAAAAGSRLFLIPVMVFTIRLRCGPWETVASILIALGVVMLMQPLAFWTYMWPFLVTLAGTVRFIDVSHFPE